MLKGRWGCFKGLSTKTITYNSEKCNNDVLWDDPTERAKGDVYRYRAFLECHKKEEK
ncbi:MAG: hypothetical protein GX958_11380 [Desulfitobacterium sp.]|nr:hypothetical protein [Desulfitobacterium sp.]